MKRLYGGKGCTRGRQRREGNIRIGEVKEILGMVGERRTDVVFVPFVCWQTYASSGGWIFAFTFKFYKYCIEQMDLSITIKYCRFYNGVTFASL